MKTFYFEITFMSGTKSEVYGQSNDRVTALTLALNKLSDESRQTIESIRLTQTTEEKKLPYFFLSYEWKDQYMTEWQKVNTVINDLPMTWLKHKRSGASDYHILFYAPITRDEYLSLTPSKY